MPRVTGLQGCNAALTGMTTVAAIVSDVVAITHTAMRAHQPGGVLDFIQVARLQEDLLQRLRDFHHIPLASKVNHLPNPTIELRFGLETLE